ncbi:unnamed protein product, partial [Mesorhabditis belari]|uniref:Uncharacterized protein n=1 Tax=Mesorhabditis belari TaxID=2138241 RepID=A0AAF3FK94_9BILA
MTENYSVSHVNILTKTVETVNGTKFNKYTLQHLEILKGGLELPSVVLVPMGPCGLELEANVEYLLSGVLTGESNLYSGLCLQILTGVLSPVWSLVDDSLVQQIGLLQTIQNLVCQLLEGLVEPLLGKLLVVLPGLDALGGLGGVGGLTGGLGLGDLLG